MCWFCQNYGRLFDRKKRIFLTEIFIDMDFVNNSVNLAFLYFRISARYFFLSKSQKYIFQKVCIFISKNLHNYLQKLRSISIFLNNYAQYSSIHMSNFDRNMSTVVINMSTVVRTMSKVVWNMSTFYDNFGRKKSGNNY